MALPNPSRAPTKRLAEISLDDITSPMTKRLKPDTVESSTSGSTEPKNHNEKLNILTKEQTDLVQSRLRKDPSVLGTCQTFQELRARHLYYLAQEEKAMFERSG
jgi:hypothetical protein